jgi:hypothetical protein
MLALNVLDIANVKIGLVVRTKPVASLYSPKALLIWHL